MIDEKMDFYLIKMVVSSKLEWEIVIRPYAKLKGSPLGHIYHLYSKLRLNVLLLWSAMLPVQNTKTKLNSSWGLVGSKMGG